MSGKFFRDFSQRYYEGPKFEEIDRMDPVAFDKAKDQWIFSRFVELEKVKIKRERVEECYQREEVNSKQNCRQIVIDYMTAFRAYKAKAYGITEGGRWGKWKVEIDDDFLPPQKEEDGESG